MDITYSQNHQELEPTQWLSHTNYKIKMICVVHIVFLLNSAAIERAIAPNPSPEKRMESARV